ncbi:MAG: SPOR domain-containing protein [Bacteroidales bacterium]
MKPFIFILALCLSSLFLRGQNDTSGRIIIVQDPIVDSLIQEHIAFNQLNPTVEGYRIQIYFESGNNARTAAMGVRDRFMQLFPTYGVYLTFTEPYYRVRVGDFRDKMSAEAFLQVLLGFFPNAFIVPDNVYFEKFQD